MKFLIITHVPHGFLSKEYFAYAPYVREMNIWTKFATAVELVAPLKLKAKTDIDMAYVHQSIVFNQIKSMDLLGIQSILKALLHTPITALKIFQAMRRADHIHLRCPGNIGLLGCLIQILFPRKIKTAKYAGNWDLQAKQPLSYRLQKWILNNSFLTRNMQVLVYGEWEGSSKNIRPFFTATYNDRDKTPVAERTFSDKIRFLFIGTLSPGKQPRYVIEIINELLKRKHNVVLDFYGEGAEFDKLQKTVNQYQLQERIFFNGNQPEAIVRKAYQQSHFMVLASKSEGWPKVVAESMFWGCIPVATAVSCVPYMLDHGKRGLLLSLDLESDVDQIETILKNPADYQTKMISGMEWSRKYTLDLFESEIKVLMQQ